MGFLPEILMLLYFCVLIGIISYFFVLATRLVRAIERIAEKYSSQE
jgi:hypothetical protein